MTPPKRYLVLNADDFGYSARVNAAVLRAHHEGVLTSASLMVAEEGWEEAVTLARQTPTLGVGLHVVVSWDRSLLPPAEIPHLVGSDGQFGRDPFRMGLRYMLSPVAQAELRREMEAQFARFAETGLPWSHADGHQHFHLHPVVWDIFLELCRQYGVHRMRLPHEELRRHLRQQGDGPNINTLALLVFRILRRRCQATLLRHTQLSGTPVFAPQRVYGHLQTGNMTPDYTLGLLDRLHHPTNEIYFHPGSPHAQRLPDSEADDVELQALLSPTVRERLTALSLQTGTYPAIEAALSKRNVPPPSEGGD